MDGSEIGPLPTMTDPAPLGEAPRLTRVMELLEESRRIIQEIWVAEGAARRAVPPILVDRDADLRRELRTYLDTLTITSNNIGDIRRSLFVPWESSWNGWVRDETAERENAAPLGRSSAPPLLEVQENEDDHARGGTKGSP